jgi:hypothetical protein
MPRISRFWLLFLSLALTSLAHGEISDDPGAETLRYVVDQRDGSRVAGAIVVARWNSSFGVHGSPACNRLESYISDPDGSFKTPNDLKTGFVLMAAYKRGYEPGRSPRIARRGMDGNMDHWQVVRYRRNADNTHGEIDLVEPAIYTSEDAAQRASREYLDVYVQRSDRDREARLEQLHRMRVSGACGGLTLSTPGAETFYKAIYDEQVELKDSSNELAATHRYSQMARPGK